MDLSLSAEQLRFRSEVAAFIKDHLPDDLRRKGQAGHRWAREDHVRWQRILNDHGWGAPGWPTQYGGTGWDPVQRFLFDTECALARAPREIPFGLNMVAPVIMAFGTAEQKAFFLPRIRTLEHWWAQGYSEPGAGSDLAALKTSAVREGDHYVVNGQKIWTTLAHFANWIFCLVRTSFTGKRQEGISFLLIDLSSPGIEVRPIRTIDGEHELNEVWFDQVRVPVANLIGEEGKGWTYAKYLLTHERADIARVGRSQAALQQLKDVSRRYTGNDGRALDQDADFARRVAWAELRLLALRTMNMQLLAGHGGDAQRALQASKVKIVGSELQQEVSELALKALGPQGLRDERTHLDGDAPFIALSDGHEPADDTLMPTYLNMRKTTIYGGSNEVQKNIIAQSLGL
jgi:alkylation response protein AidB-like acyl-CoA dehydrogenase